MYIYIYIYIYTYVYNELARERAGRNNIVEGATLDKRQHTYVH